MTVLSLNGETRVPAQVVPFFLSPCGERTYKGEGVPGTLLLNLYAGAFDSGHSAFSYWEGAE